MVFHERPGVYSDYAASSVTASGSGEKTVALIGVSDAEPGLYDVTSCEDAAAFGEESELYAMVRAALKCGAGPVMAYSLEEETTAAYGAAFEGVLREKRASYCAIGSTAQNIQCAFAAALCEAASQKGECIGVVGMDGATKAQLTARAAQLDCERVVLLGPNCYEDGAQTAAAGAVSAAALCGLLAAEDDPALPLNGAALKGFCGVTQAYSETEIDELVRGGVTVLEYTDGAVCVLRGITTKQTVGEGRDCTYRELGVIRVIDDVIPAIRRALSAKFARAKNNAVTRSAIRSQVIVELEDRVEREIIDGYEDVTVRAASDDATVCTVSFRFSVTHGLNRVLLTAQITV